MYYEEKSSADYSKPYVQNQPYNQLLNVYHDHLLLWGLDPATKYEDPNWDDGYDPLDIHAATYSPRTFPMTPRQQRLRALGMFCHTIEDSWCAAHCSRTYPNDNSNDLKYKIVGFNHYYRQKSEGLTGDNRHKPYDQVCQKDTSAKIPGGENNNLRLTLICNPVERKWDFLDWFQDRYAKRGTNNLNNFVHQYDGSDKDTWSAPSDAVEYKILKKWLLADRSCYKTNAPFDKGWNNKCGTPWNPAYPCNPTLDYSTFKTSELTQLPDQKIDDYSGNRLGFNTLGMSEAINTMAALFEMFYRGYSWNGNGSATDVSVRDFILNRVICCAFKDDDLKADPQSDAAKKADTYICGGGRRSLNSADLLVAYLKPLSKKYEDLGLYNKKRAGQGDYGSDGWIKGCGDPMVPLKKFVKWQDWWETYFNKWNDASDGRNTAECQKVQDGSKTKGYTEQEGLEMVDEAYKLLVADMNKAVELAEGSDVAARRNKVASTVGATGMKQVRSVMEDLCGIHNEFMIQLTGKLPN